MIRGDEHDGNDYPKEEREEVKEYLTANHREILSIFEQILENTEG